MKLSKLVLAGISMSAVAAASPAAAQDGADARGVYFEADAGIASVSDTDVRYYDSEDEIEGSVDLKDAFTFGGALGYDFGTIRTELAVMYSKNDIEALSIDSVNGSAVTLTPAEGEEICDYLEADGCSASGNTISYDGGRMRQLSAMANLWVDFPIGGTVVPYVGGGLGVAGFETDGEGEAKFAWQLGAGVAFNLAPSTAITLNYRHRQVSDTQIEYDDASGFEVGNIRTNEFTAGVRFVL